MTATGVFKSFLGSASRFDRDSSVAYQVFMLGLCLYAISALAIEALVKVSPDTAVILDYADLGVCVVFFLDFLLCLYRARGKRWNYFVTWGWLDLLSAIPALDVARWGRLARIFRIFRVLRGLRMAQIVSGLVQKQNRAESTVLASGWAALILIVTCSVAILRFEDTPESNIRTGGDAIWWAFATITTVGYGDRFPVTAEGRVIASILMTAGVALSGTMAAFLAAWFLKPAGREEDREEKEIARQISLLREAIERQQLRDSS